MNSQSSILPLVETHIVSFDNFSIYIEHIHDFEVVQLHNIVNYDKDFAVKLWDKIEDYIITKVQPVYQNGIDSEYNWRDERYSAVHSDIKERAPLGFFCRMDGCYFLDHQTIVDESNEDFSYWFSLKLRQYDQNLQTTSEFLKHHLKENFGYKKENFNEFLEMCMLQYPEMFSDRLCLTVRAWMSKNLKSKSKKADLLNDAQSYNSSKEPLLNDAQTYNDQKDKNNVVQTDNVLPDNKVTDQKEVERKLADIKKMESKLDIYSMFKWQERPEKKKEIKNLLEGLISKGYIKKIDQKDFKNYFNGSRKTAPPIDWLKTRYSLIYLIDNLKLYLNPEIYNGKDGTIGIAYFEQHFLIRGKKINKQQFRTVKSDNDGVVNKFTKIIDLIISSL